MISNKAKQVFARHALEAVYEEEIWYLVENMFDNDWYAAYEYIVQGDSRLGVMFPDSIEDADLLAKTKEKNPDFDDEPVRVSWNYDALPQNEALEVVFEQGVSVARATISNNLTIEDL